MTVLWVRDQEPVKCLIRTMKKNAPPMPGGIGTIGIDWCIVFMPLQEVSCYCLSQYFHVVSGMSLLIVGLVFFLGVFGFLVYQLLTPGSLFRYYLCRIGSCSDHHLNCDFTSREEVHYYTGYSNIIWKYSILLYASVESLGKSKQLVIGIRCSKKPQFQASSYRTLSSLCFKLFSTGHFLSDSSTSTGISAQCQLISSLQRPLSFWSVTRAFKSV